MAAEVSTIQSLKAVDAWIDVINANINGGVRTAFKSSRLKFAGTNTDVQRSGTSTNLPLQFPETGLQTANTVIDFSQGAVTASTENTHLAIQGTGFFVLVDPAAINSATGLTTNTATNFYLTRDGEFHTNAQGLLVNADGYYLVTVQTVVNGTTGRTDLNYGTAVFGNGSSIRAVYDDLDNALPGATQQGAVKLSEFVQQKFTGDIGAGTLTAASTFSVLNVNLGMQSLQYSQFGSTVFSFGYANVANPAASAKDNVGTNFGIQAGTTSTASVLSKSLEASNASMTQSVPELSLAQKLFSALTKVLQVNQTNTDSVINLIR